MSYQAMKRHGETFMNIIEREKEEKILPTWKIYVLSDSNSVTALWKRQNYGDTGFLELGEEEMKRQRTKDC